jgi:hypothetical protein
LNIDITKNGTKLGAKYYLNNGTVEDQFTIAK